MLMKDILVEILSPLHSRWILLVFLFLAAISLLRVSFKNRFPGKIKRWVQLLVVSLLLVQISLLNIFFLEPEVIQPELPVFTKKTISKDEPLEILFNRPILPSTIANVVPYTNGNWELTYNNYTNLFVDGLTFTPDEETIMSEEMLLVFKPMNTFALLPKRTSFDFILPIKNVSEIFLSLQLDQRRNAEEAEREKALSLSPQDYIDQLASESGGLAEASNSAEIIVELANVDNSSQETSSANVTLDFGENQQASHTGQTVVEETPNFFQLDVPLHKQTYTFTCFATASRMVMEYKGITKGEVEWWDSFPKQNVARNQLLNVWGDPNQGIVGNKNGTGVGGYGAHWQPVADTLSQYTEVEVKQAWNVPDLLNEVYAGNPVMVWWVNGVWPAYEVSWNLPNGDIAYTVNGMHVEVVTGWQGDINNPTQIYTNDPWRGYRS